MSKNHITERAVYTVYTYTLHFTRLDYTTPGWGVSPKAGAALATPVRGLPLQVGATCRTPFLTT